MTLADVLLLAQQGVQLAQTVPAGDPRVALALNLAAAGLQVAQVVAASGTFSAGAVIEADTLGLRLVASIQAQLEELGDTVPQGDHHA